MPTYEYLCLDCAERVEVVQSFTDDPLSTCQNCGGKLRKVIYPVGIQFKGSGFYSTDGGGKPAPRPSKVDAKEGSASGDKGGNGEKKPKSGETKSDRGGDTAKAAEKTA